MVYDVVPSMTTPEDLAKNPAVAKQAEELYATTRFDIRTNIPSSTSYLPLSHFIPAPKFESYACRSKGATEHSQRATILARQVSPRIKSRSGGVHLP